MSLVAYIARQPILDVHGKLHGYELLYRDAAVDKARIKSNEHATASVLVNVLSDLGMGALTDGTLAYINFNDKMLVEGFSAMLPVEEVVLQLVRGTQWSPDLIVTCRDLRNRGYQIALDDYGVGDDSEPLLDYVNVVRLDLHSMRGSVPRTWLERLRERSVSLLAEKIETWEAYTACKDLGCTLFQGHFFARAEVLITDDLTPSHAALLDALRLLGTDVELSEIESALSQDVGLIYKILRYANAAAFTRPQHIESLQGALVLLGRERLRVWLSLLLYAVTEENPTAHALLDAARLRSAMMRVYGEAVGFDREQCNEAQVVGSFSLLEPLLQRPLATILEHMVLPDRMRDALLVHEGAFGPLLHLVEVTEKPWSPEVNDAATAAGVDPQCIGELQMQALAKASATFRT